ETPMSRNWSMLKLAAALSATLAVAPAALAQETIEEIVKRLDKMDKDIKAAFKSVTADLDNARNLTLAQEGELSTIGNNVKKLERQMAKFGVDLENMKKRLNAEPVAGLDKTMLDEIRSELSQIKQTLSKLQPTASQNRVALFPPNTGRVH